MIPLGMTLKVNLLATRLMKKMLLKKKRKNKTKTKIPTNKEGIRVMLTVCSFPALIFLKFQ